MNIMIAKRATSLAVLLTVLVSVLAFAPAASAYPRVGVRVYAPLPPIRHERVLVRPGPNYVWVPGYWRWEGRRYAWIAGTWVLPPRPGAIWVGPRVIYRYHHPYYYGGYWRYHGRRW
jgi:WXXGXW repeat (2 copies)